MVLGFDLVRGDCGLLDRRWRIRNELHIGRAFIKVVIWYALGFHEWLFHYLFELRHNFNLLEKLILRLNQGILVKVVIVVLGPVHDENHEIKKKANNIA